MVLNFKPARNTLNGVHPLRRRDTPVDQLTVHLGDYDLTVDNETEHQARGVSRVLFHSHFHPFLLANDIALLRLDRPASFSDTVRPVCLPTAGGEYVYGRGDDGFVDGRRSGWMGKGTGRRNKEGHRNGSKTENSR